VGRVGSETVVACQGHWHTVLESPPYRLIFSRTVAKMARPTATEAQRRVAVERALTMSMKFDCPRQAPRKEMAAIAALFVSCFLALPHWSAVTRAECEHVAEHLAMYLLGG